VDSMQTYLSLQEEKNYIKILINYGVNNPAPHRGRGHKAATAAALVKVALPRKLLCPTCVPTLPGSVWAARVVGGMSMGATASGGSATKSGGGGSGVVLDCCLVLEAGCCVRAA
jgi:hypothetical protein